MYEDTCVSCADPRGFNRIDSDGLLAESNTLFRKSLAGNGNDALQTDPLKRDPCTQLIGNEDMAANGALGKEALPRGRRYRA